MWLVALSVPIFFLLIIIELVFDRFHSKKHYRLNDFFSNINTGIGFSILSQFANIFGIGLYIYLYNNFKLFTIESNLWIALLVFVLVDLLYYIAHRTFHQVNFLWVDHSVHHLGEDFNLASALRVGYYQMFYAYLFYAPLAIFGFEPELFIVSVTLSTIYQFSYHTEKVRKLGILEKILVTPSHHRVHHGRNPKYLDKNFGGFFIFWDKLFGSYEEEESKVIFGITEPPNSFNPLYIQTHYLRLMIAEVKKTKGFKNKLKVLINRPGWNPASGEVREVPEIDYNTYQKYDVKLSNKQNIYMFVQALLLIFVALFFLTQATTMDLSSKVLGSIAIFLNIFSLGVMFDGEKWSFFADVLRFLLPVLILPFIFQVNIQVLVIYILFALVSVTISYRIFYKNKYIQQKSLSV